MITLKTFDTSIEAHILKSRLEIEGIPTYIFDENIVTLNPLYNNLVGGVKLKISEFDLARAQKILNEIDAKEVSDDEGKDDTLSEMWLNQTSSWIQIYKKN